MNERTQLQDATARLAAIVEGSEDAIYRLHAGWRYHRLEPSRYAAVWVFGRRGHWAQSLNHGASSPPKRNREILNALAFGERIQQFETTRQRKDGSLMDVSFTISPIMGQDGTIIGGSTIVRDITNRKRMDEALRRSEERFRLVARATKDAISDWDIRSGAVWRSENFWEQFGYPPKDTEPDVMEWRELIHPEDRDRVWNGFQTALSRHVRLL